MSKIMANLKNILGILSLAVLNGPLLAEEDYLDMDLEQLVEVKIFAASVFTAHIHEQGDWMFSYDYSAMSMKGSSDHSKHLSTAEILDPAGLYQYQITPVEMTMDMHMFHLMYAPSNDLTVMLMAMQVEKDMLHQTRMGNTFSTQSSGWSDTHLKANYIIHRIDTDYGENEFGVTFGISIPTGSIDEKDITPMSNGNRVQLPYPMQLGSGTYDFILGGMYLGISENWYWGAQAVATLRTGKNDNGYRLANHYNLKAWLNKNLNDNVSTYLKIDIKNQGDIDGSDSNIPAMMPTIVPTADPLKRDFTSITLAAGIDLVGTQEHFNGHRFGIEIGKPVYQDLNGPQLEIDWHIRLTWQKVF